MLIQSGMHIGVALLLLSFVGVWAIKGLAVAGKLLSSSVATSIASDAYAVIPMFVLMGLFVSATNMGRDTFDVAALVLRRIRGALGIATVAANAVFAACTGTTIASASVFTKVAVPEMIRHGHTPVLGRRGGRQLGARHADSAEHSDDHLRRHRQRLDRRPVHLGHPARHRAGTAFCVTILLMAYLRAGFGGGRSERARSGEYHGPLDEAPRPGSSS